MHPAVLDDLVFTCAVLTSCLKQEKDGNCGCAQGFSPRLHVEWMPVWNEQWYWMTLRFYFDHVHLGFSRQCAQLSQNDYNVGISVPSYVRQRPLTATVAKALWFYVHAACVNVCVCGCHVLYHRKCSQAPTWSASKRVCLGLCGSCFSVILIFILVCEASLYCCIENRIPSCC